MLEVIYSNMQFFVSDKWGKSEDKRQDEGLRQGDPLSCFLLVILMTVNMLDARKQYSAECSRRGMTEAQRETEDFLVLMMSNTQTIQISFKEIFRAYFLYFRRSFLWPGS